MHAFKRFLGTTLSLISASILQVAAQETSEPATSSAGEKEAKEVAVIDFKDYGKVTVEFWPEVAPETVENFKKLAKEGFYDGTASHRLIAGFMIQLGDPLTKDSTMEARWGSGDPGYKIKAEFNKRKHVRGVLSMARSAHPDSAGSQFFICFDNATSLDNKYTAFGKVVDGEEVLAKLEKVEVTNSPSGRERSKPVKRIHVESIRIVDAAK